VIINRNGNLFGTTGVGASSSFEPESRRSLEPSQLSLVASFANCFIRLNELLL